MQQYSTLFKDSNSEQDHRFSLESGGDLSQVYLTAGAELHLLPHARNMKQTVSQTYGLRSVK